MRPTYVVTEGLLTESVLRQRSFKLDDKVSVCRIDEKAAMFGANTTVARADGSDGCSLHRELGSSTITGALIDSHFCVGCHYMWCFVGDYSGQERRLFISCYLIIELGVGRRHSR